LAHGDNERNDTAQNPSAIFLPILIRFLEYSRKELFFSMPIQKKQPPVPTVCHERLEHLASIALDVVETILSDMETPINVRLEAAFRIFELCEKSPNNDLGDAIVKGIEKNAHELAYLEALLKAKESNSEVSVGRIDKKRE